MDIGSESDEAEYPRLFMDYIQRSVYHSLSRVRRFTISPSAEIRNQARHVLGFALELDGPQPLAYDLLLELAPRMEEAGHRDDWLPYLERGICHSRKYGQHLITARLLIYAGMLHQLQGRISAARECFEESYNLAKHAGSPIHRARALIRLAYVERLLCRPHQAADLARQANDLLPPDHVEAAAAFAVLGIVAYDLKDWPQAISHLQMALSIAREQDDPRTLARCRRDLGMVLRQSEDLSGAVRQYSEAIDLFDRLGDQVQGAVTRLNLSAVYLDQGRPDDALALLGQAEPALRNAHDHIHLAHIDHNRGLAYCALHHNHLAADHLQRAADRYARLGRTADQAEALAELEGLNAI